MITKTSIKTLTMPAGALTGTHTPVASSATVMTDSAATFTPGALVGLTINDTTDANYGVIVANTAKTVTVLKLGGGTHNYFATGDAYTITLNTVGAFYLPFSEFEKVTDAVVQFDEKFAAGNALGIATMMLPARGTNSGTSATVMTDATLALITNALKGLVIRNVGDGSSGVIVSNTATTVTVTALTGGTANTWVAGNTYYIGAPGGAVAVVAETLAVAAGTWAASVIADVYSCKIIATAKGE